jgi:hypothetical protein
MIKNLLLNVLIFIFYLNSIICEDNEINGKFYECLTPSNMIHLQFDQLCHTNKTNKETVKFNETVEGITKKAFIFTKHDFVLEGTGYECSIKITQYIYKKYAFYTDISESQQEYQQLTRLACYDLVKNKICNKQSMVCRNQDQCSYTENVHREYPWVWGTNTYTVYDCRFHQRIVMSMSNTAHVIPNPKGPCTAKDLECRLETSIVVWSETLLRACAFERIVYVDDMRLEHIALDIDNGHANILYSNKEKTAFQLTNEIVTSCQDINFIKTTSHLYIAFVNTELEYKSMHNLPVSKINSLHLQTSDYQFIRYAENDYNNYFIYQMILKTECISMLNIIRNNLDQNDKFLFMLDQANSEYILYINNGMAYIPHCKQIQTIKVLPTTGHCYRDIAVHYYKTNTTEYKTGFLRSQGILTQLSTKASCEDTDMNLVIDESSVIIKRKSKIVTVEAYTISLRKEFSHSFVHPVITHLFDHHQLLMNASNILETMNDIFTSKEGDDVFFVKKNLYSKDLIRETSKGFFQFIADKMNSFYSACLTTITTIWNIILLTIVILIGYKLVKWYKRNNFTFFRRLFSLIKRKKSQSRVLYENTPKEVIVQSKVLYNNLTEKVIMKSNKSYNKTREIIVQPNAPYNNTPKEVIVQPKVLYNNITEEVTIQPKVSCNNTQNEFIVKPKKLYNNITEEVIMQPNKSYNNTPKEVIGQSNVPYQNTPKEVNVQPNVLFNNISEEVIIQPKVLFNNTLKEVIIQPEI